MAPTTLAPTTLPPTTNPPTTNPPTTTPPTISPPIPPFTANSSSDAKTSPSLESSDIVIIVLCVVVVILLVLLVGVLFAWNYSVRTRDASTDIRSITLISSENKEEEHYGSVPEPPVRGGISKSIKIQYKELKFGEKIGEGSFGSVMKAKYKGIDVAVKISSLGADANQNFLKEAEVHLSLSPHSNIVDTLGLCFLDGKPMLVLEFMANGSLRQLYKKKKDDFTFTEIKTYLSSIAAGMTFLHQNMIIHRDLACRNILISEDNTPKISDFGMSRKSAISGGAQETNNNIGPVRWMSPESIRKFYEPKSDVWSFGMVIWEIIYKTIPFGDVPDLFDLAIRIRDEGYTPETDDRVHPRWRQIMTDCWAFTASNRPNFEDLETVINDVKEKPI
eukprot:CAMPEP_0168538912 /NCGR_PEP_ID=MMETSP0405-20121227/21479_1 /TAXON_ID=498012 /ORGANISM="Trichosphaerium sp, Strain Am-I-7 wt" /LENGTH=389 /DNA_ID=CAMNT_0008568303 /DNA_START=650 /DNA_END=1819 /DNA_ORIENTATION=+